MLTIYQRYAFCLSSMLYTRLKAVKLCQNTYSLLAKKNAKTERDTNKTKILTSKNTIVNKDKPKYIVQKPEKFFKQIKPIKKCNKLLKLDELNLLPSFLEALKIYFGKNELHNKEEFITTEVQTLLIPEMLKRFNASTKYKSPIVCGAETGSGKTLAYLIPTIQIIKQEEEKLTKEVPNNDRMFANHELNAPKAIIMAPSCELVDQIFNITKDLSHLVKFRVVKLSSKTKNKDFGNRIKQMPIDILVCTPLSLVNVMNNYDYINFHQTNVLCIDEADTLFDDKFIKETSLVINKIEKQTQKCQIVMTTATIPQTTYDIINKRYSDVLYLSTKLMHKVKEKSQHVFIDLKHYQGNRNLAILDILRQYETRANANNDSSKENGKIIIFCNTRTSVLNLVQYLRSRKVECLALFSRISNDDRIEEGLKNKDTINSFIYEKVISKSTPGNERKIPNILICTDLASRGLDTSSIDHVINYDFPRSKMDYLHRAGRTSRVYNSGVVSSLLGLKERKAGSEIESYIKRKSPFI